MEPGTRPHDSPWQGRTPLGHLLILGHPDPASYNHAVAARYADVARSNYQEVELRDLYAIEFDPLLKDVERPQRRSDMSSPDVQREINLIEQSAVISFIYPLWFGTPPAIIKGYIDRVFSAAFQLSDLRRDPKVGPFAGKTLSLFTSSAGTGPWLDEMGIMSSLQQSFGRYLERIFGFSKTHFFHADSVVEDIGANVVERHLFEAAQKARLICAEAATARHRSVS